MKDISIYFTSMLEVSEARFFHSDEFLFAFLSGFRLFIFLWEKKQQTGLVPAMSKLETTWILSKIENKFNWDKLEMSLAGLKTHAKR